MNYTVEQLVEQDLVIFDAVMGSRAYGTSMPNSDYDTRGVFVQPLDDILKYGYVEQVSDKNNDVVYYELKRFLEMVRGNNPNIMELLNAPEDMVFTNTPCFKMITDNRHRFITTRCRDTFGGYAVGQIKKARGLNKKMNWDEKEMVRKTVLDFCYLIFDEKSVPLKDWLEGKIGHMDVRNSQEEFGLAKVDHARDLHAMYYLDPSHHKGKSGIVKDEETANDIQLVSIPKGASFIRNLIFNKDGYSSHCKLYKEYVHWLASRNEDRFKMNKEHGKNYDSKNMAHCIRLLDMANEIATDKEINVRRTKKQIELLLKIRKGELEYEKLLNMAEEKLKLMDDNFAKSSLPKDIDPEFIACLLLTVREKFYKSYESKMI